MRFVKYTLTLLLLALTCTFAQAQQAKLKRAERLMGQNNYTAAIDIYRSILDKGNDADAVIGIAEAYRRVGNSDETEYWYGLVTKLPNAPQKAGLYYAMALHQNGKCEESKKQSTTYLNEVEPNNTQAMWLLKSCEEGVVKDLRASGKLYNVTNVEAMNTEHDEFSPQFFKGDLVFISSRENKAAVKRYNRWTEDEEKPFTEVYTSKRTTVGEVEEYMFRYGAPSKFSKKLSSKFHDGPLTFNSDFNEIYFTRSNMEGKADDGVIRLKVYQAQGGPSNYGTPKPLPFNSDDYSVLHPALSPDGEMLFFASDMPGGFGGYDLYVSYLEEGRWSPPVNLGPTVNTEGNEVFPFYHDSGTLYFASNGGIGLGGLDIYYSQESFGAWTEPINVGYPVNTPEDDFGFIINQERTHGYFSSNRAGGKGGDDIYTFTKLSVTIHITVYNEDDLIPIEAADVFTPCSGLQNLMTNQDGKVIIELPLNMACDFAAEKLGFQPNSIRVSSKNQPPGKVIIAEIPLKLECIFIVEGAITDGLTGDPIEGAQVTLQTYCSGEQDEITVTTDAEGKYEFRDVREDCDIKVTVEKAGFTKNSATFKTGTQCGESNVELAGGNSYIRAIPLYCFGENCEGIDGDTTAPYDPNDTTSTIAYDGDPEECIKKVVNLRNGDVKTIFCDNSYKITKTDGTEEYYDNGGNKVDNPGTRGMPQLVNIYYNYDDAGIRSDAKPELEKLYLVLKNYPEMKIVLSSHTDARGKKGYNKRLSKRRAESVIRYLMSKGIDKSRLKANGMGETVMINNCYDGIECTEEQHQENRRTEFVITEYIPQGFNPKSSTPKKIKVAPCSNCPSASEVEGDLGSPNTDAEDN